MTDKVLIETLMKRNNWTQTRLAEEIGFDMSNITRILKGTQKLSKTSRKVAEMLLRDSEEK